MLTPRWITSLAAACLLGACTSAPPPPRPTAPAPPTTPAPPDATRPADHDTFATPTQPPRASPLLADPRCAVFLDAADVTAALGVEATAVTFLDSGLRPPPLIEVSCAWDLADGTRVRLEVDDLLWTGAHDLADEVQHQRPPATPVSGLGDLAFRFQDVAGTTVAWAIRHGGADRTLRIHGAGRPPPELLTLATLVRGDASPDLWTADIPLAPTPSPAHPDGPE